MGKKLVFCLIMLGATTPTYPQNESPDRVALVIGIQNYSKVAPLRHSLNDATDMTAILRAKGFVVESLYDPKTKTEVKDAITRYYNTMRQKTGAVGIIYYAGHGIQNEGENYIVPANAYLQVPGDLDDQCVKMDVVTSVLNSSGNLNILLMDACRASAFPSFSRDISGGLAVMEAPRGAIVVFATQPKTTASDGTGRNGLFTSKLLKYINEPNLNIEEVLKRVKKDVNEESGGKQLPSVVDNSLGGDFYFTKADLTKGTIAAAPVVIKQELTAENESTFDYGYGTANAPVTVMGTKTWLAKNLNVTMFANGELIPEAKTAKEWKKASGNKQPVWCYYNFDERNGKKYGRLYNWYAVNDKRGLAPKGWHVPSDTEWDELIDAFDGEEAAGTALKNNIGWQNNGNGNNRSGFAALPSGEFTAYSGEFEYAGSLGFWWSTTEKDPANVWVRTLRHSNGDVFRDDHLKGDGYAVRCLKD